MLNETPMRLRINEKGLIFENMPSEYYLTVEQIAFLLKCNTEIKSVIYGVGIRTLEFSCPDLSRITRLYMALMAIFEEWIERIEE